MPRNRFSTGREKHAARNGGNKVMTNESVPAERFLSAEEISFFFRRQNEDDAAENDAAKAKENTSSAETAAAIVLKKIRPLFRRAVELHVLPRQRQQYRPAENVFSYRRSKDGKEIFCRFSESAAAALVCAAFGGKNPQHALPVRGMAVGFLRRLADLLAQPSLLGEAEAVVLRLDVGDCRAEILLAANAFESASSERQPAAAPELTVRTRPIIFEAEQVRQWQAGTFVPLSATDSETAEILVSGQPSRPAIIGRRGNKVAFKLIERQQKK